MEFWALLEMPAGERLFAAYFGAPELWPARKVIHRAKRSLDVYPWLAHLAWTYGDGRVFVTAGDLAWFKTRCGEGGGCITWLDNGGVRVASPEGSFTVEEV